MPVAEHPRALPLGPLLAEPWAVAPSTLSAFLEHLASRRDPGEFFAAFGRSDAKPVQRGAVAVVPIHGFIAQRAGPFDDYLGITSTDAIRDALRGALADPAVTAIVLDVDSPGGTVPGITELASEIRAARGQGKRIIGAANTMAASAAYWLISQADEIVASPSAIVGSIGVFTVHQEFSGYLEAAGVKTTLISAGDHKTDGNEFEPLTDEARQSIQDRVDASYAAFVDGVAAGRGITAEQVKARYEGARVFMARPALAAGLVDFVGTFEDALRRAARAPGKSSQRAEADSPELVAEAPEPFTDRLALLREDAEALADHATQRAALRAKEGRASLSDTHLASIRSTRDAMDALLALADPAAGAATTQPPAVDPPPAPPQPVAALRPRTAQERAEFWKGIVQ